MEQKTVYSWCSNCGAPLETIGKFCVYCGQEVKHQSTQSADLQQSEQGAFAFDTIGAVSKKEYRKICKNKNYLSMINAAAIICYVCAGINLVIAVITQSVFPVIDVAITVPLAILLHTKKSKGCAIAILVYSIIGIISNLVLNGMVGGWLWLVAGISAVQAFSVCDKEYEATMLYRQFQ